MGSPLPLEPILEADDRYALHSRIEILSVLRSLHRQGAMVTINFDQGREFILTTIVAVDTESDEVLLDFGADARANALLLKANRMHVVGNQDRVRIEFSSNKATQTTYENRPTFSLRVPSVLTRLQRRDFYRLDVPKGGRVKAYLQFNAEKPEKLVEAELVDISCGGVAIMGFASETPLREGELCPACSINLPGVGTVSAPIRICSVADVTLRNGAQSKRIGCHFVRLNGAMQAMIQRFINNTERERARLRR